MCLFQLWFCQGICPEVGLLGHMVVLFLVFKGISILFSIMADQFTFPPTVQEGSLFSTPSLIVCRFFDAGHFDQCEVIPHCSFDLHFCNNEQRWTSFHAFISHQGKIGKVVWSHWTLLDEGEVLYLGQVSPEMCWYDWCWVIVYTITYICNCIYIYNIYM